MLQTPFTFQLPSLLIQNKLNPFVFWDFPRTQTGVVRRLDFSCQYRYILPYPYPLATYCIWEWRQFIARHQSHPLFMQTLVDKCTWDTLFNGQTMDVRQLFLLAFEPIRVEASSWNVEAEMRRKLWKLALTFFVNCTLKEDDGTLSNFLVLKIVKFSNYGTKWTRK